MVAGRNFSVEIESDLCNAYILNETAVKVLGWDDAIGKTVRAHSCGKYQTGQVIGVVKDFNFVSLHNKIEPLMLRMITPRYLVWLAVKVHTTKLEETLAFLEKTWHELLGLSSQAIEHRTKEIGVRKVLGASVASIAVLISSDFIRLVALANVIAWPVAYWAMSKWLQDFAYRIILDFSIFVLGGLLALVIALAVVSYQTFKAARSNPIDALRCE